MNAYPVRTQELFEFVNSPVNAGTIIFSLGSSRDVQALEIALGNVAKAFNRLDSKYRYIRTY